MCYLVIRGSTGKEKVTFFLEAKMDTTYLNEVLFLKKAKGRKFKNRVKFISQIIVIFPVEK